MAMTAIIIHLPPNMCQVVIVGADPMACSSSLRTI